MGLKDKVAIVGYGETPFSRARVDKGETKLSVQEYFAWACDLALEDAGLEKKDIDGQGLAVTGLIPSFRDILRGDCSGLGLLSQSSPQGRSRGSKRCGTSPSSTLAISSGKVDLVLCVGADTPMNITTPGAVRTWRYESDFQKPFGIMGPNSQFAFILRRHMHRSGTKPEALGKVAVVQREHAIRNPHGYLKAPLTMEQYLGSRMIADPIRLFDACISVNGALHSSLPRRNAQRRLQRTNPCQCSQSLSLTITIRALDFGPT